MKIVCISDTHLQVGKKFKLPVGDVLIHAGDGTGRGSLRELATFADWFARLPHKHKILIAGNHDFGFQEDPALCRTLFAGDGINYLEDSGVTIDGVKFWGSPWQPWFLDWAFNLPRGAALKAHWDLIPNDTDVLITHSPPYGILDTVASGEDVGCQDLRIALARVKPKVHVFGHIHESYGRVQFGETLYVNAAVCDASYRPINKPQVVEITTTP